MPLIIKGKKSRFPESRVYSILFTTFLQNNNRKHPSDPLLEINFQQKWHWHMDTGEVSNREEVLRDITTDFFSKKKEREKEMWAWHKTTAPPKETGSGFLNCHSILGSDVKETFCLLFSTVFKKPFLCQFKRCHIQ